MKITIWLSNPEKEAATPEGQQLTRGFAKMSRGYWEDAALEFDSCSEFQNVTEQAMVAIANDYAQVGRHDKALSIFNTFLRRQPPGKPFDKILRANTYRVRGACYRDLNRFAEACADYLKSAELAPPEEAKADLEAAAELYRKQKKYTEAMDLFNRAAPSHHPGFYHHRGLLYEELGKQEEAIGDYSTSIRMVLIARKKNSDAYGFVLRKLYEARASAYDRVG